MTSPSQSTLSQSTPAGSGGISEIQRIGQSIWYDNCSRDVLQSGELARLIAAGVSGLTSNPTIFQKAISTGSEYTADIERLSKTSSSADEVCEALMVADVGAAADLLRPKYEASQGRDGHASIEVSPKLAHDTAGTIAAARRLWSALGRPNAMIKIPATREGLPAIEECLVSGININITLIFSVERYREVAHAYIRAIQRRVDQGLPVDKLASVASFFVSRVDAILEKELETKGLHELQAKIGIANSLFAYQAFEEIFLGNEFEQLRAKAAQKIVQVQRPLWASTGTKNPALPPLLYVQALVAPHTVNTLPPATLAELLKGDIDVRDRLSTSAQAALSQAEAPEKVFQKLADAGINFPARLAELEAQGVKSFADSYESLLQSIAQRMSP